MPDNDMHPNVLAAAAPPAHVAAAVRLQEEVARTGVYPGPDLAPAQRRVEAAARRVVAATTLGADVGRYIKDLAEALACHDQTAKEYVSAARRENARREHDRGY